MVCPTLQRGRNAASSNQCLLSNSSVIRAYTQDVGHPWFISSFSSGSSAPKAMIYVQKKWVWFFVLHTTWCGVTDYFSNRNGEITILRQNNFRFGSQPLRHCTFHRSYKTVIGSGGVTCSCCHALHPVCACALTWALKKGRSFPSFPGKDWDRILFLELCGTNIIEKSSFPWDFTEISSLRQGTTGPKQGHQCQCTKYSRHGALGSAGGRTKAMKACMGEAPQHFET